MLKWFKAASVFASRSPAVAWNRSRHTGGPGYSGRKTVARYVATDGGGKSSDSLPGSRTFGGLSCAMSGSPRIFLGCYTWPAASFCCGVYEMTSSASERTISLLALANHRETMPP
jgi:hypothetical protein